MTTQMKAGVASVINWRPFLELKRFDGSLQLESFLRNRLMTGNVSHRREKAWAGNGLELWEWVLSAYDFVSTSGQK